MAQSSISQWHHQKAVTHQSLVPKSSQCLWSSERDSDGKALKPDCDANHVFLQKEPPKPMYVQGRQNLDLVPLSQCTPA